MTRIGRSDVFESELRVNNRSNKLLVPFSCRAIVPAIPSPRRYEGS